MPLDPNVKSVYHSALVSAGEVQATIKSNAPLESKFKKGTFYLVMSVDGSEHQFIIENDAVKEALTGYGGQTVTLRASGSREDATIEVDGINVGEKAPAPKQAAARPAQHVPTPPAQRQAPAPQQTTQGTTQAQAPHTHAPNVGTNITEITYSQQMCPRQYESIKLEMKASIPLGEKLAPHYKYLRDACESMLNDAIAHRNRES